MSESGGFREADQACYGYQWCHLRAGRHGGGMGESRMPDCPRVRIEPCTASRGAPQVLKDLVGDAGLSLSDLDRRFWDRSSRPALSKGCRQIVGRELGRLDCPSGAVALPAGTSIGVGCRTTTSYPYPQRDCSAHMGPGQRPTGPFVAHRRRHGAAGCRYRYAYRSALRA